MANGRYTQNIFTPQTEQYDIGGDILKAIMREQGMRAQQESRLMEMAQTMNPVKLMSDKLTLDQYDMISAVEDSITAKMKAKKGRLNTDDMLNIQFQIRNLHEWQQQSLAKQDKFAKDTADYQRNPDDWDQSIYANRALAYVSEGLSPASGTYLEPQAVNWDDWKRNYKIDDTKGSQFKNEEYLGDNKEKTRTTETNIFGAYSPNSPFKGTEKDPLWVKQREQAVAYEILNSRKLMKGVYNAFNSPEVPDEERAYWTNMAEMENSTPSSKTKDAQGNEVKVSPWYMWAVNQAGDIQPTNTDINMQLTPETDIDRMNKREGVEDDVFEPVVLTGDDAVYEANLDVKKKPLQQPLVTYSPTERTSLEPLKTSKNFQLTGDSYIIGYTAGLFKDSKLGFASDVGKQTDTHAVSKEGNEIWRDVPIYSGEKEFTTPKIKVKMGGKEVNKKFTFKPEEPVPQEVVDAMNEKEPGWGDANTTPEDKVKVVFDFGSKSMVILNPVDEYTTDFFGGLPEGGAAPTPPPKLDVNAIYIINGEEYTQEELGWADDEITKALEAGKITTK